MTENQAGGQISDESTKKQFSRFVDVDDDALAFVSFPEDNDEEETEQQQRKRQEKLKRKRQ